MWIGGREMLSMGLDKIAEEAREIARYVIVDPELEYRIASLAELLARLCELLSANASPTIITHSVEDSPLTIR